MLNQKNHKLILEEGLEIEGLRIIKLSPDKYNHHTNHNTIPENFINLNHMYCVKSNTTSDLLAIDMMMNS